MQEIQFEKLDELLIPQNGPCVSIYFSVTRKSGDTHSTRLSRFRKLFREATHGLSKQMSPREVNRILQPLSLFSSLGNEVKDARSFCCFASQNFHGFFPLDCDVHDECVVANDFNLGQLTKFLTTSEPYRPMKNRNVNDAGVPLQ